jgi:endonuclease-8
MEGPSLVILKEELAPFRGKKVRAVAGNTSVEKEKLTDKQLIRILSWGKLLLLQFNEFHVRIHFLMYGSYRINERKEDKPVRLSIIFDEGEINFYNCSVRIEDGNAGELYDWSADTMSPDWDEKKALKKIKAKPNKQICDVLMDQEIFAGVGNIIKNEVLYLEKLDPRTPVQALNPAKLKSLVKTSRDYCFKFYEWKKVYQLKKHWKIFRKRKCPACGTAVDKGKTGTLQRWSFSCPQCQELKTAADMRPVKSKSRIAPAS